MRRTPVRRKSGSHLMRFSNMSWSSSWSCHQYLPKVCGPNAFRSTNDCTTHCTNWELHVSTRIYGNRIVQNGRPAVRSAYQLETTKSLSNRVKAKHLAKITHKYSKTTGCTNLAYTRLLVTGQTHTDKTCFPFLSLRRALPQKQS